MADLCTKDELRDWLNVGDDAEDSNLQRIATSVSADFLRAIKRPALLTADYTEVGDGDGTQALVLRHWPITAVDSVTVGGVTIPESEDGGVTPGWYVEDTGDPEENYTLRLSGAYTFTAGTRNVEVDYSGGYSDVPEDIKQAVLEWAEYRRSQRGKAGVSNQHMNTGETVTFANFVMPASCAAVAANYRREIVRL